MPENCPFCEPDKDRIWVEDDTGFILWDAFPVSEGHTLVVPKQHVTSLYNLPVEMQTALWKLVADARSRLEKKFRPDGFNVGLNDDSATETSENENSPRSPEDGDRGAENDVGTEAMDANRLPHLICHMSLELLGFPVFATVKVGHGPNVLASLVIVRRSKYW